MATATSSRDVRVVRRAIWSAAGVLVIALAVLIVTGGHSAPAKPAAFSWLRPAAAPAGWGAATTRSGATLAYPPGWHSIETDPGTASAAPAVPHGPLVGYLNATPQEGNETLANWSRFRVKHVAAEGARRVHLVAAATGLRFRSGHGSCVIDSYSTAKRRFREIACIVAGSRPTTVIVAAAPAARWAEQAPVLERAVAAFAT